MKMWYICSFSSIQIPTSKLNFWWNLVKLMYSLGRPSPPPWNNSFVYLWIGWSFFLLIWGPSSLEWICIYIYIYIYINNVPTCFTWKFLAKKKLRNEVIFFFPKVWHPINISRSTGPIITVIPLYWTYWRYKLYGPYRE